METKELKDFSRPKLKDFWKTGSWDDARIPIRVARRRKRSHVTLVRVLNLIKKLSLVIFTIFQGLTYTQICNWFANWRRKLKNTSNQKKSWGNLIKNYNFSAKGNVEQFSICSGDSIWGEAQKLDDSLDSSSMDDSEAQDLSQGSERKFNAMATMAHGQNFMLPTTPFFQSSQFTANFMAQAQCFQISSTTNDFQFQHQFPPDHKQYFSNSNKFKNHIMEKYLRGLDDESANVNNNNNNNNNNICDVTLNNTNNINNNTVNEDQDMNAEGNKKPELSKWLESTANFMPSNYNVDFMKNDKRKSNKNSNSSLCEKELLAAETLVLLKNNFRTKFYNS